MKEEDKLPKEYYLSKLRVLQKDLAAKISSWRKQWVAHNFCKCVSELAENNMLNCEHFKKHCENKFKKEFKEIDELAKKWIWGEE